MQVLNRTRVPFSIKAKVAGLVAVAMASAMTAPAAFAQATDAVDVSVVTAKITAQLGPIGLIGVAVLGVVVAIMAFKWVRRSLS